MGVVGCCCCPAMPPPPSTTSWSSGAGDMEAEDNNIEYELTDFLLLGEIEEACSSIVSPSSLVPSRQWQQRRLWHDPEAPSFCETEDEKEEEMERKRSASFLEFIDSDLFDVGGGVYDNNFLFESDSSHGQENQEQERQQQEEAERVNDSRDDGQHSEVSAISTHEADRVLRNLIVQCLARNNREGRGGGGGDPHSNRFPSEESQPPLLSRDSSMVSPRPRNGSFPSEFSQPPPLSRDPSMLSQSSEGGLAMAKRGSKTKDPPTTTTAELGKLQQRQKQQQLLQRRQPPRPDVVRYHYGSNKSKIHANKHTHDESLSLSSDLLSTRGQHYKRMLLDSMASSSPSTPSSPMAPLSLSAMIASGGSVQNHPRGALTPHQQHEQRQQHLRQSQVPRSNLVPSTATISTSSSTIISNSYHLKNPNIAHQHQLYEPWRQEPEGEVGVLSQVLSEQSMHRRRRFKELLWQQKQEQLSLKQQQQHKQQQQQQQQRQKHHQHQSQPVAANELSLVGAAE